MPLPLIPKSESALLYSMLRMLYDTFCMIKMFIDVYLATRIWPVTFKSLIKIQVPFINSAVVSGVCTDFCTDYISTNTSSLFKRGNKILIRENSKVKQVMARSQKEDTLLVINHHFETG